MTQRKKLKKIRITAIQKSEYFSKIMEKYELVGRHMTSADFHKKYVETLDPTISYRQWNFHVSKIDKKIAIKTNKIMNRVSDSAITDMKMEQNSLRKILTIADITLEEVIDKPELLEQIPIAKRMAWFFSTMNARDSRMTAVAKINAEKRKTSMFEDMLQSAQYGGEGSVDQLEGAIVQENAE